MKISTMLVLLFGSLGIGILWVNHYLSWASDSDNNSGFKNVPQHIDKNISKEIAVLSTTALNQEALDEIQVTTTSDTSGWRTADFAPPATLQLPRLTFKYPAQFTRVTSITPHDVTFSDDENRHGLVLDFSKNLYSFLDVSEGYPSFDKYVATFTQRNQLAEPRFFQAGSLRVARVRHHSASDYDGDVGTYFIELSDKSILTIVTSGNKKYLFDDDESGMSTRDKIVSTISIW